MIKKQLVILTVALMLFGFVGPAAAITVNWSATLDGLQAMPSVSTTGTGSASGIYDDVTNILTWSLEWVDLLGDTTVAHFHLGAVGVNGPVIETIFVGALGSSGSVTSSAVISELDEASLLAGLWYINIHTSISPSGEIRGQVIFDSAAAPVPEPSTFMLFGVGLIGLAWYGQRRANV